MAGSGSRQPQARQTSTQPQARQGSFAELGTPLFDTTFVVVDLETTGGSPAAAGITEIGAVKTRGGAVLGEFQTLVNPGAPIPPLIAALTGITEGAVAGAPGVAAAVASFLEFAAGSVLVAHNAPYDTGFLRGACALHQLNWPNPATVDTARLARAALLRDEVPNVRLATLARLARSTTQPCHRALADARATADVLHYLIGRVGDLGVTTVEELAEVSRRVSPAQRRKRSLAEGLPTGPGVYQFLDSGGSPLYIGTSRNVRERVRSYFTAAERRTRMAEMVALAERVEAVECATGLEAAVRESRLLAAHKPPYNRRSRFPEREAWLALTAEPFPRLSVVAKPPAQQPRLGPFPNRGAATSVVAALQLAFPIRSCTRRLPLRPVPGSACIAADLGQCGAPCDGRINRSDYAAVVDQVRQSWERGFGAAEAAMRAGMRRYAERGDFERATSWREGLAALGQAVAAAHRHEMLASCAELVAAQATVEHGWEIHVIRHGRLAAAGVAPRGTDPRGAVERLQATAEVVAAPAAGPAASLTEVGHLHRWLSGAGVRLVVAEPSLSMPVTAAHRVAAELAAVRGLPEEVIDVRERGRPSGPALPRVTRISAGTDQTSDWETRHQRSSVAAAEPSAIAARAR